MSYHRISVIQSNRKCHLTMGESTTIYHTYRWTSFFGRRRFLRFWTIKLNFITFAFKNQYTAIDWSRRVVTGKRVNWPAAYSWITLDSRYTAKISAVAYLRMRLISEYIRHIKNTSYRSIFTQLNYFAYYIVYLENNNDMFTNSLK